GRHRRRAARRPRRGRRAVGAAAQGARERRPRHGHLPLQVREHLHRGPEHHHAQRHHGAQPRDDGVRTLGHRGRRRGGVGRLRGAARGRGPAAERRDLPALLRRVPGEPVMTLLRERTEQAGAAATGRGAPPGPGGRLRRHLGRYWQLWVLLLPAIGFTAVFAYVPMYGIQLAFREFDFQAGLTGGEWVGLKYFEVFFSSPMFGTVLRNTLTISITTLVVGFLAPIALALIINQIVNATRKRFMQTATYLPHFISI